VPADFPWLSQGQPWETHYLCYEYRDTNTQKRNPGVLVAAYYVELCVSDSGVKLSLGKSRVKKKQVEMMIGQNIITRTSLCITV